jgi:hypothetical protein
MNRMNRMNRMKALPGVLGPVDLTTGSATGSATHEQGRTA